MSVCFLSGVNEMLSFVCKLFKIFILRHLARVPYVVFQFIIKQHIVCVVFNKLSYQLMLEINTVLIILQKLSCRILF
jgi:hypothetical protein